MPLVLTDVNLLFPHIVQVRDEYRTDYDPDILLDVKFSLNCKFVPYDDSDIGTRVSYMNVAIPESSDSV